MKKLSSLGCKVVSVGGLTTMGLIATVPSLGTTVLEGIPAIGAWVVIGLASASIITDKTPTHK